MKHHLYRILAICLALCAILAAVAFAEEEPTATAPNTANETESTTTETPTDPTDVPPVDPTDTYEFPDNWSRDALVFAVKNGILAGDQYHNLNPEKSITRAEMAAVLVRMLAASGSADLSAFKDVPTSAWYYKELSAAVAAGIFTGISASKMDPNAYLTREQAIVVLTRAFGIADTGRTSYTKFKDANKISSYARDAVSAMVTQNLISGYSDGGVHPQSKITRAEIAQLIYNMFDCIADTPEEIPASGRVLYRGADALPDPFSLDGSLVIAQPYTGPLSPSNWNISETLSVRCGADTTADFSNLKVGQLVFAPVNGKLTADTDKLFLAGTVDFTGNTKALTILSGNSTVAGSCDELVLREGAYLVMTGDVAGSVIAEDRSALVLRGNADSISAASSVGISVFGDVDKITLGSKCNLHCNGNLNSISIGDSCIVTLEKDMDSIQLSSNNVHLTLNGRVNKVSSEGENNIIDGSGRVGELSYVRSTTFTIACDSKVNLWQLEYQRDYDKALSTVKSLKIPCIAQRDTNMYQNNGGSGYLRTIAKGETIYNEYWPSGAYMRVTTSNGQRGWVNRYNFFIDVDHISFDGKFDYSNGTKDGFVNLRGYSSATNYLIWISRYTQKVIIYTGSKGNWKVYKTFPCASGSAYTPTPEGIYEIYSKTWMWDFHGYMVNNVSLFNGGMAFHSYLLNYDGTDYNSSLGRPMSHGCIRMKPTDAAFIYKNIPQKTTVVVY